MKQSEKQFKKQREDVKILAVDHEKVKQDVLRSLEEDLGAAGDITGQLLNKHHLVIAQVITREPMVVCGRPWVDAVYRQLVIQWGNDSDVLLDWQVSEGEPLNPGQVLFRLLGPADLILMGERTALNWLQLLSGTATLVARYVAALRGLPTQLLDTRKTLPSLRYAQKYAVRCAGGVNHRFGLYDAYLIKENHIISCGSVREAVARARQQRPGCFVEVEVENLQELREAIAVSVDRVMLDNFSLPMLKEAVDIVLGQVPIEVSGNVNLDTIYDIAATGVDYISVGSLTKHLRAIDLSLRIMNGELEAEVNVVD